MRRTGSVALDDVPEVPVEAERATQDNGDVVYAFALDRWRFSEAGKLIYWIRYETEKQDSGVTYEAPRQRRRA